MLKQKYINVIRTCLKINRAMGNEKSKADIEETLIAFDAEVKMDIRLKEKFEDIKNRYCEIQSVFPSNSPAPKAPGK
jgi:hypothetical protein